MPPRIFLLSPATCTGARAQMLLSAAARFGLAAELRSPRGAPLGDVFAFLSGLYFRGKIAYAQAFARPPRRRRTPRTRDPQRSTRPGTRDEGPRTGPGTRDQEPGTIPGIFVITPSMGLQPPDVPVTIGMLEAFAQVQIDVANQAYRAPLEASATLVATAIGPRADVVLLGSIATGKYVDVLDQIFGDRLLFPADFVGRGDMSRGGLLLRCVRAGIELDYAPVRGAIRHGARPPRLPREPRQR